MDYNIPQNSLNPMNILDNNSDKNKGRHIQVFSDGCSICNEHITNVEIGKCFGCKLEVHLLDQKNEQLSLKLQKYRVSEHPTTIIDDEIKIEGKPEFYWQCGGSFYDKLRNDYPLKL